jgi:hypothetical protein
MEDMRRRRILGGMMALLAVVAVAAITWPGGGALAPARAQASPDATPFGQVLAHATREMRAEAAGPLRAPKGSAALVVAREFAQAFVVYEIGGEKKTFKAGFDATATDQLVKALLQRPPRQPADGKVPMAKVVNVVAGPSKGKVHQFSVSLLRVGVTSELRLEMEQGVGKKWQVTNVLG